MLGPYQFPVFRGWMDAFGKLG